ncbi:GNAT family N-acetyltransferase [Paenibacillus aquistagni]|uniref:Acetoin utilization protein AcuA n=1 Tax=Paenibacillus aquistagni TaxID=1852522 RepID=A0A1X7IHZ6_9BACL|nr:GNAT family N-acetyltransferase [Paenibacillus aquistagni]SMG14320.1 acetoin utilization protein AcuA [Paenibacillus aquistagni]
MEHFKRYHAQVIPFEDRVVIIEGPVKSSTIETLHMHADLDAFRRPNEQQQALIEIAELEEGRIIIARDEDMIIGYVTFHYPDPLERWSEGKMDDLIELGAIEVARDYRGIGLGKQMIGLAFLDDQLENCIVYTTEYYWHWDLDGTGLNVWDYRKMMELLMKSAGMIWYATDDPEICSHPANCLMVRIGKDVPLSSKEQFDRLRFRQRFMY